MSKAYHLGAYHNYFGNLKNGKKVVFRFKTLRELDLFWTHAVLIAIGDAQKTAVVLSFIPHDWFDLLRPTTADVWFQLLGKKNPHCNVITHAAPEEKKLSEHPGVTRIENMFGTNPLKQKESFYLNVIDDLILEATLDEGVVPGIRNAMRGIPVDVPRLLNRHGIFKLNIRQDSAKALALKKKAQKYFSIRLYSTKS